MHEFTTIWLYSYNITEVDTTVIAIIFSKRIAIYFSHYT